MTFPESECTPSKTSKMASTPAPARFKTEVLYLGRNVMMILDEQQHLVLCLTDTGRSGSLGSFATSNSTRMQQLAQAEHSHLGPMAAQTPAGAWFGCREIEMDTKATVAPNPGPGTPQPRSNGAVSPSIRKPHVKLQHLFRATGSDLF